MPNIMIYSFHLLSTQKAFIIIDLRLLLTSIFVLSTMCETILSQVKLVVQSFKMGNGISYLPNSSPIS